MLLRRGVQIFSKREGVHVDENNFIFILLGVHVFENLIPIIIVLPKHLLLLLLTFI